MKKIVGIIRSSTDRQETDSQKKEVLDFVVTKGFNEDEIEWVEFAGASARKANEEYKTFIRTIKSLTQGDGGIKNVAMWHLNRLGRIKKYLVEMESFFVENKVQMYVKNGFDMPLLDENGKETLGASIAFSVYSALIEEETNELMEKTKRGRERNDREGKWNGGKLKFGYTVTKDLKIVIDSEKAEIVKNIFHLYVNEKWSCKQIYEYYVSLNIFKPYRWKNHGYKTVTKILKDKTYTEGNKTFAPFISKELQEKALEMLDRFRDRRRSDNIYFCKGLIRDKETQCCLNASRGTLVYTHLIKENPYNISINVLDYIAWLETRKIYIYKFEADNAEREEIFRNSIQENNQRITFCKDSIKGLRKEIENAVEQNHKYPKYFPTEKVEAIIKENEKGMLELEREIIKLENDNLRMTKVLEGKEELFPNGTINMKIKDIEDPFFNTLSDEQKKKIIDECISKIEVERLKEKHYRIRIHQHIDIVRTSEWDYYNSGHKIFLTEIIASIGDKLITKDHTKAIHQKENHHFVREDYWRKYYQPKKVKEGV